jgi:hypothetical protein
MSADGSLLACVALVLAVVVVVMQQDLCCWISLLVVFVALAARAVLTMLQSDTRKTGLVGTSHAHFAARCG